MIVGLVPAAGLSRRMGRPKLLLRVGGVPLIARVVDALRDGGAGRVVVVVAPAGTPGATEVAELAEGRRAEVVVAPGPTPDMRASVELGLAHLAAGPPPVAVLLAPGDSPGIGPGLVGRLVRRASESPGRIVVPRHRGRSGHPVLIPWPLAARIPLLPAGVGVNALMAGHADAVEPLDADDPGLLADLDTPDDYLEWSDGPRA